MPNETMDMIHVTEDIPVRGEYDVIVAGGGVAGVSAALSSSRMGKRVLLIEKSLTLGGLATLGLINFFVPMDNGRGRQIVFGMAEELLRASVRDGYDTIPAEWLRGEPGEGASTRYVTRFSATIFAMTLTGMLASGGVTLLLDSVVSRPVMAGSRCEGLIVENKTGRSFYRGGMIVDATGDLDIMARAGLPTVLGKNYFTYWAQGIDLEHIAAAARSGVAADALYTVTGGNADLYGHNHPADMPLYHGTTAEEVTDYIIKNHNSLMGRLRQQARAGRDVASLPGMPQFRTTRHLVGDYTLRGEDEYRHFDDSVGAVNDFDCCDRLYEIPFRCLYNSACDNLITAGRSVSAEGWAWDVTRVIPPAILTGQAAGAACALALDHGLPIARTDVGALQRCLTETGVMIHFDDSLILPSAQRPPLPRHVI